MTNCSIVWFGDCERSGFDRVVKSLRLQSEFRVVRTVQQAVGPPPSYVILPVARPGEVAPLEVAGLKKVWSQSQFVWLLGEWCWGEKRRSDVFGGATVLYLHELLLPVDLAQFAAGPETDGLRGHESTDLSEIFHSELSDLKNSLAAIYSRSRSLRGALADTLSIAGMSSIELQLGDGVRTQGVEFVIWDPASAGEGRQAELREIRRRHPAAEIVALLSWPGQREADILRAAGVRVLGQPFALRQLFRFFSNYRSRMVSSAA